MPGTGVAAATGMTVVVPVKRLAQAKSRLDLPPHQRRQVALQLAVGTVATLLASPSVSRVLVVTADREVAALVRLQGAGVLPEPRRSGLNRAVAAGWAAARRRFPCDDLAAIVSDLPELTLDEVDAVVAEFRSGDHPLLVVDHLGVGTTMLLQRGHDDMPARFGPDSAARHLAAGYLPSLGALPGLRRDLDHLERTSRV